MSKLLYRWRAGQSASDLWFQAMMFSKNNQKSASLPMQQWNLTNREEFDVIETTRRSLITGLIALVAAPAVVRAGPLMPVKQMLRMPDVLQPPLPIYEEVQWIGSYYIHFDKDGSGNCTWELVRGPDFKEIVTPVMLAA